MRASIIVFDQEHASALDFMNVRERLENQDRSAAEKDA
jgi:hypothetical protein